MEATRTAAATVVPSGGGASGLDRALAIISPRLLGDARVDKTAWNGSIHRGWLVAEASRTLHARTGEGDVEPSSILSGE